MTNNKQQTAVKLYTEEQVLEIIANINRDVHVSSKELLEGIEVDHIELPSDEEIWDRADEIFGRAESEQSDERHIAFMQGAKWMRNKIQGGDQ
jgi:hypothetical protein